MSSDASHSPQDYLAGAWQPSIAVCFTAALIGGLVGLMVFQQFHPVFPYQTMRELPIEPTDEQLREFTASHTNYYSRNNALNLAIVGGCLGLAVGGITVRRRHFLSAVVGALSGALAGAAGGFFTGFPIGKSMVISADQSLVQAGLLHFCVWGPMALGIAVTVGLIQGGFRTAVKAAASGLVAGLLVIAGYILVASIAFPRSNLIHTVPETLNESILWILTCAVLFASSLYFGLQPTASKGGAAKVDDPKSFDSVVA